MSIKNPHSNVTEAPLIELPLAVITVGGIGHVHVTLDGADFPATEPDAPWSRARFGELLDALTLNRTRTIRVEVRESDGTVFTDIIHTTRPITSTHLPAAPSRPATVSQRARRGRTPQLLELGGAGFIPGEDVTVALTISSAESDARGVARALIDLAQLAEYATEVLLIGNISGRIITEQLP